MVSIPLPLIVLPSLNSTYSTCNQSELCYHYAFGHLHGKLTSKFIHSRLFLSSNLHDILLPYINTPEGNATLYSFLDTCQQSFPRFLEEMRGMADGGGVPFDNLFLMNMEHEMMYFANVTSYDNDNDDEQHCSDYIISNQDQNCLFHNEDGSPETDIGNTYILVADHSAVPPGRPSFTTYNYAGQLPSNAFGFNSNGIGFTIDNLQPRTISKHNSIGKTIVSRSLLEANNIQDAIDKITIKGQASGHNIQIIPFFAASSSSSPSSILTIEVGPDGLSSIATVNTNNNDDVSSPYFHANEYLRLNISQIPSPASRAREQRVTQFPPPRTVDDLKQIMGDEVPINGYSMYRSGGGTDYGMTLHSVFMDAMENKIVVYQGNPKDDLVAYEWSLSDDDDDRRWNLIFAEDHSMYHQSVLEEIW